jgi:hypothetical protein
LGVHHPPLSRYQMVLSHRSSKGNGSHAQEKTVGYGQQTIREAMHSLQERPAKDPFRHDAHSWMDLVHLLDTRTPVPASGDPLIVMVQPSHDRKSDHFVPCILSAVKGSSLSFLQPFFRTDVPGSQYRDNRLGCGALADGEASCAWLLLVRRKAEEGASHDARASPGREEV